MKYSINVNVLKSALNLVIIKNNISPYYRKSALLQISVNSDDELKLNTETYNVCSEMRLKGSVSDKVESAVFVDSLLFQSLIGTINEDIVTLDFVDSGIDICTKSSTLKVPKLVDIDEMTLTSPTNVDNVDNFVDIPMDEWKFISQYQASMLGTGMSFPIYRNIWFSKDGTVVAGDYDAEVFTKSKQTDGLNDTCLLSDTMLNLIMSMPENSNIVPISDNDKYKYVIKSESDSYVYCAEFEPLYESDEYVGSYNAEALMTVMTSKDSVSVDKSQILPLLNQAKLFGNVMVELTFSENEIRFKSQNVNGKVVVDGNLSDEKMEFEVNSLIKVLNNFNNSTLSFGFSMRDDNAVGMNVWDEVLTITVGKR